MQRKAQIFQFSSYRFEPHKKRAIFRYTIIFTEGTPLVFEETIILPKKINPGIPDALVKKIMESLHLMLGISYWKFYCPRSIEVPYELSKFEADFWNTVWKKGLGEFFYRNQLNPHISPRF